LFLGDDILFEEEDEEIIAFHLEIAFDADGSDVWESIRSAFQRGNDVGSIPSMGLSLMVFFMHDCLTDGTVGL